MIYTSKKTKDELQKEFGCSRSQLSNALRFTTDSVLCRRIRRSAVRKGGTIFLPKC